MAGGEILLLLLILILHVLFCLGINTVLLQSGRSADCQAISGGGAAVRYEREWTSLPRISIGLLLFMPQQLF